MSGKLFAALGLAVLLVGCTTTIDANLNTTADINAAGTAPTNGATNGNADPAATKKDDSAEDAAIQAELDAFRTADADYELNDVEREIDRNEQ